MRRRLILAAGAVLFMAAVRRADRSADVIRQVAGAYADQLGQLTALGELLRERPAQRVTFWRYWRRRLLRSLA